MTHNYQSNGTMGSAFAPSLTKEDLYRASMATYGNGFGAPMSGAPNPIEIGQSTGISDVFGGMSYTACGGAMSTPQMMTQTPTLQETGNWMTYLSQEMSVPMRNMAPVYQSYDPNYLNQMTQTLRPERTWQDDLSEWMVDSNMGRAIGLGLQGGANSTFNPFGYAMRSLGIDTRPLQPNNLAEEIIEYGGSAAADTAMIWDSLGSILPRTVALQPFKAFRNVLSKGIGTLGSKMKSVNPILRRLESPIHFTKKGGQRLGKNIGNYFLNKADEQLYGNLLKNTLESIASNSAAYYLFPGDENGGKRFLTEFLIDDVFPK